MCAHVDSKTPVVATSSISEATRMCMMSMYVGESRLCVRVGTCYTVFPKGK